MPLYEFSVIDNNGNPTGEKITRICKYEDRPEFLISSEGRKAVYDIKNNQPARMKEAWSGACGTWGGVNGTYDVGAGRRFESRKQQDQWLKDNGYVRESDMGRHYIDDQIAKQETENSFLKHVDGVYQENLKKFGDTTSAAIETWSQPSVYKQEQEIYGSKE